MLGSLLRNMNDGSCYLESSGWERAEEMSLRIFPASCRTKVIGGGGGEETSGPDLKVSSRPPTALPGYLVYWLKHSSSFSSYVSPNPQPGTPDEVSTTSPMPHPGEKGAGPTVCLFGPVLLCCKTRGRATLSGLAGPQQAAPNTCSTADLPTYAAGDRAEGTEDVLAGSGSLSQSTTNTSPRTKRPSARQADTPIPSVASTPVPKLDRARAGKAPPPLGSPAPVALSAERTCVKVRPRPLFLAWGVSGISLCHLSLVVAGRGRGGASIAGPLLPRPQARPWLSPPHPPLPTPVGYRKVQVATGCPRAIVAAATSPDGAAESLSGEALRVRPVQGLGPAAQPHHAG